MSQACPESVAIQDQKVIQAHLDEAVAEGSIPALDTHVATLAWLGALNEVVVQSLYSGRPDLLTEVVPALTPILLRSIGAKPAGGG